MSQDQEKKMDGNAVAKRVLERVKQQAADFAKRVGRAPKLIAVLFGNDAASLSYIRKKEESAKGVGIDVDVQHFPDIDSRVEAKQALCSIDASSDYDGMIVQLPLPEAVDDPQSVLEDIDPGVDADCLSTFCLGWLAAGDPMVVPPTAGAVLELLDSHSVDLEGKHIVVVGHGKLVGKPLSILLTQKTTTVTICNEHTNDLALHTKQADILISATGVKGLITGDMVKEGAVVLDAGTAVEGRKVSGDIDEESVLSVVSLLSPVPGGVGPVTVAKLLENVVVLGLKRLDETVERKRH